jgi:hypothetical protein
MDNKYEAAGLFSDEGSPYQVDGNPKLKNNFTVLSDDQSP